ncbi:MAG: Rho termination factor N-terminal domain-containing protein [Actinobacteria bacterium]|nr:Rho termination factor N-terminal domain-containing protein [Actinomycetota bacterium]
MTETSTRFPFRIDRLYRIPALLVGVREETAWVELDRDGLRARFGPWFVSTPLANVTGAGVSGPYSLVKTVGPAHLSLQDQGLTFATNGELGACLTFAEPVAGIEPTGRLRHPGLTVTVADPEALVEAAAELGVHRTDAEALREVQEAEDALHAKTAAELREIARQRGVSHPASIKKAELVALLDRQFDADLLEDLTEDNRGAGGR